MSSVVTVTRFHDFSAGHRVSGHESKCAHLHGHNYRAHFTVVGDLDALGRVLDFSAIRSSLCDWLERCWDHRFLIWDQDPLLLHIKEADPAGVVPVPFNPTAEQMAKYLLRVIGPQQLQSTGCMLVCVEIEETRKCSARAALEGWV